MWRSCSAARFRSGCSGVLLVDVCLLACHSVCMTGDVQLNVRVPAELAESLRAAAEAEDRSVSSFVRRVLKEAVGGRLGASDARARVDDVVRPVGVGGVGAGGVSVGVGVPEVPRVRGAGVEVVDRGERGVRPPGAGGDVPVAKPRVRPAHRHQSDTQGPVPKCSCGAVRVAGEWVVEGDA